MTTDQQAGGRSIFYEGEDPESFRQSMIDEFGFDPAADEYRARRLGTGEPYDHPTWHQWTPWAGGQAPPGYTGDGFWSYHFWCPPHAYNAVYHSGRWPMGS